MKIKSYWVLLALLIFEFVFYNFYDLDSLEVFIGFCVFIYFSVIIFTLFKIHPKEYSVGNDGNNFSFLAIDKIDKLFKRPTHTNSGDYTWLRFCLILLIIHILLYIYLYVI
jgi:hypothetical protein